MKGPLQQAADGRQDRPGGRTGRRQAAGAGDGSLSLRRPRPL